MVVRSMGCLLDGRSLECPGRVAAQEHVKVDRVEVDIDVESVGGPSTHKLDYVVGHPATARAVAPPVYSVATTRLVVS